jgi:hypothetical protein
LTASDDRPQLILDTLWTFCATSSHARRRSVSLDLVLRQAVLRGQPEEISTQATHRLHATCNRWPGASGGLSV